MLRREVLDDDRYRVPDVPSASRGVAWLRSHIARFSDGDAHARRRGLVDDVLASVPPERLRRSGDHIATLASALGLPRSVSRDVRLIAACYQPTITPTPEADEAVTRLVAVCGGVWDEATAATICVLVQASDATSRMIEGHVPPVATTRRIEPDGDEALVDLSGAWFGAGRHACPGEAHAWALVDGVARFRSLHDGPEPFVLPNAWDVASAALFASAGFAAVGTTSLGVAAAHGLPDGAGLTSGATLQLAARLVELPVPITIDVESGWEIDPARLAEELWELGVAGVNIEDGHGDHLVAPDEHARAIAVMKRSAPQLFVNARVDTHWLDCDQASTVTRAQIYEAAGADGVFVPGANEAVVAEVVDGVMIPVNVLADRPLTRWRDLGVRRISSGSLPYRCALAAASAATLALVTDDSPPPALAYHDVNALAAHPHGPASPPDLANAVSLERSCARTFETWVTGDLDRY